MVSAVEHPAVMAPVLHLRDQGWALTILSVDRFGQVSVMHANNEVALAAEALVAAWQRQVSRSR